MSRSVTAVQRAIKAYDVRGLVGVEIDESFVADIGAAFARLMRDEGATQVVIGSAVNLSNGARTKGRSRLCRDDGLQIRPTEEKNGTRRVPATFKTRTLQSPQAAKCI